MARTVIGIFESMNDAQRAAQHLLNYGIAEENLDISSDNSLSDRSKDLNDNDFGDKVKNFFSSLFDDKDDADTYATVARRGAIVTVHTQNEHEAERAADILDEYGAVDVDERARQYRTTDTTSADYVAGSTNADFVTGSTSADYVTGSSNADYVTGTTTGINADVNDVTDNDFTRQESTSIPIIEEDLRVGKRVVGKGGVRLRSRIVERPVEQSIRLREEYVRIERNRVDRPATDADLNTFQEGTIELTERAEVPVVAKEARVVEEVSVGKEVEERVESVRETVRSTEVDVENIRSEDRDL